MNRASAKRTKNAAKKSRKKAPAKRLRTGSDTRAGSATAGVAAAKTAPRPRARRTRESAAARKSRAERLLAGLRTLYPDADCALGHRSPYELLVATILSAQCTDERVNMVTPDLFRRFPDAKALAAADRADLEAAIRSTGFFRNKAKNLIGMASAVCDRFGGRIPDEMDHLLGLPGVARKTANCVLGTAFGKNEGVVVDTHVGRLALRLRLLTSARDDKDAVRIERDLMKLFPCDSWTYLSHALIWHGRRVCRARKPECDACALASDCPSAETGGGSGRRSAR